MFLRELFSMMLKDDRSRIAQGVYRVTKPEYFSALVAFLSFEKVDKVLPDLFLAAPILNALFEILYHLHD